MPYFYVIMHSRSMHCDTRILSYLEQLLALWVLNIWLRPAAACPNACSGHGLCLKDPQICQCFDGFTGPDCSLSVCPAGRAWADIPSQNDTAHAPFTECSAMGYCDRATGQCLCRSGFEGAACERKSCPKDASGSDCYGRGRCLSMREASEYSTPTQLYTDPWDADMIYGCICEEGYSGYDCSLIDCPNADDPLTPGVAEIQIIDCQCPGTCSGYFSLSFLGQSTAAIPAEATQELLQYMLQAIPTISRVMVNSSALHVCSALGTASAVMFHSPQGEGLPALTISLNALVSSTSGSIILAVRSKGAASMWYSFWRSVSSTQESAPCANRGSCDDSTGQCVCLWSEALPSDREGNLGYTRDCAYVNATGNAPGAIHSCPVSIPYWNPYQAGSVCSGVGNCSASTNWICNCTIGYTGTACEFKECQAGTAWFDEASAPNVAHAAGTVCSNIGVCDPIKGTCICDETYGLFYGNSCAMLDCGWSLSSLTNANGKCGDHGQCLSLAELASLHRDNTGMLTANVFYNTSWDADMIYTCACASPPIDNSPVEIHNVGHTYRGPYAYAWTSWKGYDCAKAYCPKGVNERTMGVNEVQRINCTASLGYFSLSFRQAETSMISHNCTQEELTTMLEDLSTIGSVNVQYSAMDLGRCPTPDNCNRLCHNGNVANIEFETEFGPLPLIAVTNVQYLLGRVNISRPVQGTRELLECSRQGNCDESTGICACLDGYGSSGGFPGFSTVQSAGNRGDCGWWNIWATSEWMLDSSGQGVKRPGSAQTSSSTTKFLNIAAPGS